MGIDDIVDKFKAFLPKKQFEMYKGVIQATRETVSVDTPSEEHELFYAQLAQDMGLALYTFNKVITEEKNLNAIRNYRRPHL